MGDIGSFLRTGRILEGYFKIRSPYRQDDVLKHTLAWVGTQDVVTLDYRPVHTEPLTTESEGGISAARIAPKARVY